MVIGEVHCKDGRWNRDIHCCAHGKVLNCGLTCCMSAALSDRGTCAALSATSAACSTPTSSLQLQRHTQACKQY
jgi:hypothetical protein